MTESVPPIPMPPRVPPLFERLIDDAALFPPGNAAMDAAVPDHAAYLAAWFGSMVGPFLCTDQRLPELQRAIDPDTTLELGLIVTGGAGAIEPAIAWVRQDERLRLAGLEIALRDEPDLGRNARRVALACESAGLDDGVPVSVEIPRARGFEDALDVLAETGGRAKLRTGGPAPEAFPAEPEVARFITACLDRDLPFKCTAGLHHAVRHTDGEGIEQHGFLNLVLATRSALDGDPEAEIVRLLELRDADLVGGSVQAIDDTRAVSTRRWFTSYGSCSVTDPIADLVSLELLEEPS